MAPAAALDSASASALTQPRPHHISTSRRKCCTDILVSWSASQMGCRRTLDPRSWPPHPYVTVRRGWPAPAAGRWRWWGPVRIVYAGVSRQGRQSKAGTVEAKHSKTSRRCHFTSQGPKERHGTKPRQGTSTQPPRPPSPAFLSLLSPSQVPGSNGLFRAVSGVPRLLGKGHKEKERDGAGYIKEGAQA